MTEQRTRTGPNKTEQNSRPGTEQKTEQAGVPRKGGPLFGLTCPEQNSRSRPVRLFGAGRAGKASKADTGIKASVALALAVAPAMREAAKRARGAP